MLSFSKINNLLSKSHSTERLLFSFFDQVTLSQHKFFQLWQIYLQSGADSERFADTLEHLRRIEKKADKLRRQIEMDLYKKTLIPDMRSDVASLVESIDRVINKQETIGNHLLIEKPVIPEEAHEQLLSFVQVVGDTVDHTLLCTRSFFSDFQRVHEYHLKVMEFESDCDDACQRVKTTIFNTDLPLTNKVQLRYFCDRIEQVANLAEDISDRVSIFTLKRAQ
ncbi:DUF47 domain-containing protein [Paraferrimonas haliotis]|uniref:TIGR00153 family protein n=1 Tax=Paraferrimonas haliotis TaxID=2013866 RepID=A0AA37TIP5_9GAMM|nr:DUF47 family protein [Paraferrimonas haliotis]GLS82072.1 TIGR00153 family protein [Paraferrimonas haliotis]